MMMVVKISHLLLPLALASLGAIVAILYDVNVIAYKDVLVSKQAFIRPTIGEPKAQMYLHLVKRCSN